MGGGGGYVRLEYVLPQLPCPRYLALLPGVMTGCMSVCVFVCVHMRVRVGGWGGGGVLMGGNGGGGGEAWSFPCCAHSWGD